MAAQGNAAPIIIKRKKVVSGGGHHGGAWKVAYADFVTAMMAFFMLMWLLNATTEKQRKGIADYFTPTIAINRVSGGGNGSFGGNSTFEEEMLPFNGARPVAAARPATRAQSAETADLKLLESELLGYGGESDVMENEMKHVITRLTDEGLVVELFALPDAPLFNAQTGQPTRLLRKLAGVLVQTAKSVKNDIAVGAHVPSQPVVAADIQVWDRSSQQATVMRQLLDDAGLAAGRVQRVTGYADREPATLDPMDIRNNRIKVTFLR
ncbi:MULTISPECIES: flagellar motor protein MotB [Roseobacteraceae]|jgi:chemotaxis protein MotB|uniref:Motility protein B n=1 Tax=Pseudosulfitobacter pseudonitzschiae TaxID=1402135 RepID=A0A221K4Y8_9RHOB|nr:MULTISPECIES: flagellar motor protein MotB [Roseobacteraceae]ASM74062.1 motility protein B [Pseudosulfitobacter pseudonitzschiae]